MLGGGSGKDVAVAVTVVPGVVALLASVWALPLAVVVAGGGHGWMVPLRLSLAAPLLALFAWGGWLFRRTFWGFGLAATAFAAALLLDAELVRETMGGKSYFDRVWKYAPEMAMLWGAAWFLPQVLPLATLLVGIQELAHRITRRAASWRRSAATPG
jgi:hypothetical protein